MVWGVGDGDGGQFEGGDFPLLALRVGGHAAGVDVSGRGELLRLMGGAWGRGLSALRVGIRSPAAQSVALPQNCSLTLSDCRRSGAETISQGNKGAVIWWISASG